MANYQDSNLNQVVFNKVTKEQYDSQISSGSIKENEFYLVSGDVEIPAIGVDTNGKVLSNDGSKLNWVESTSGSYTDLTNKPQINSVELSGNKSLDDLGIQAKGEYALSSDLLTKADKSTTLSGYGITNAYTKTESDEKYATIEQGNKADTAVQPTTLNNYALKTSIPTKVSQLTNDSGYLTTIPSEYITETELNGKGYQTTANMESSVSTSTTKYPSSKAIKTELDNTVHKTGDEEISGVKTFNNDINITNRRCLIIKSPVLDNKNLSGWRGDLSLIHEDKNSERVLGIYATQTDDANIVKLMAYDPTNEETYRTSELNIVYTINGKTYAEAPTPDISANNKEITTANWVNTKLNTKQNTITGGATTINFR